MRWKAVNLANLVLRTLPSFQFSRICEIGGAEGVILNSISTILNCHDATNYELSTNFCNTGSQRFPNLRFVNREFTRDNEDFFDLIIVSDVLEHVEDEAGFLDLVRSHCNYALFKIPIEECVTNTHWYYRIRGREKPEALNYGPTHMNGHLRGYTLKKARMSLKPYFHILDEHISDVAYFYRSPLRTRIRSIFGTSAMVPLFGGALFALAKSRR